MRDKLIQMIYELAEETGDDIVEDLRTWSNSELIEYYGTLRIEEYYQAMEKLNEPK